MNEIYAGLLRRGVPQHIALAYMDSFQSESGLNPTINEIAPLVPGSRGGRGLYQLTGSRRRAYEAQYGDDYDVESQLDFLMAELAGPEAAAKEAIWATDNRADAVRAITAKFLRPAHDNSDARIGSWGGNGSQNALATSQPQYSEPQNALRYTMQDTRLDPRKFQNALAPVTPTLTLDQFRV